MKKYLTLLCGFAALAFASCTQDINEVEITPVVGTPQICIDGYVNQEYVSRVDDGGFTNGDQIGLYGVNYTDKNALAGELLDEGNQVDNARYTFDAQNKVWTSSGSIYYKDAETNIDLYAYYPYASVESVHDYAFEVQQDQSGNNTVDGFSQSDFLWGKSENITPTEAKIKIRFDHRLSCVNVVLNEGSGWAEGEFAAVKKSVLVLNTARKATIDLATGEAVATGDIESEGIVTKEGEQGFRAIVVPQSVEAGKALLSITIDGIAVRFKENSTINYEAGKQLNYTLKVGKKAHSGEYELQGADVEVVDWEADLEAHGGEARQYYVVHLEEAATLEAKIAEAKKNPAKIKNLKVSGKICAIDFYFMRDKMTILQAVNLKEAEITDYYTVHCSLQENGTWGSYHYEYFGYALDTNSEYRDAILARYPNATDVDISSPIAKPAFYDNANEIPNNAFKDKSSLVYFCFPEKVTKIGTYAFSGTTLSGALIIPNDVVEIGGYAFQNINITSLQLPHGLKSLGNRAFETCSSLAGTLSLPESLEYIGEYCFSHCIMLSGNLVLPSKLTEIPSSCFNNCSNLSGDLVIPESVTKIGNGAFNQCVGLNGTLTLPKGLKEINQSAFLSCHFQGELLIPFQVKEVPEAAFANNSFTSIKFAENSELVAITGNNYGAFGNNSRLCEPVVIPAGVITIEKAFCYCYNLPAVVLPKNLVVIGSQAFINCYNLSAITCEATTPPICGTGAWNGVAKDNFTVEVPEQSVVKYQTEGGWSDFKRIAAHHDFSLSRSQLRTLNAEHSKTFVMRAPSGEAWSIESKPEWVTVTPSSGVGKVDVTVTVAEMSDAEVGTFKARTGGSVASPSYKTFNGRAGEVVFLLEGKDYRNTLTVEQYDYQYGDGDVLVNQKASVGNGVNIVFMGDCFDARDIAEGKYLKGVEEAIGHYFAIEPYKTYKEYFNIYTVFGMSADSGMGTVNTIKDAKFGSQYSLNGIAPDHATCYEYEMKAETVNENNLNKSLVVLVENTQDYGGICYMWGDGSAIAICPMSRDAYPYDFRGIVQHEAGGHGFAKLGDEYIYHNAFIESCICPCCAHLGEFNAGKNLGWYRNLSTNGDMKTVEWAHLIYHPDYSNVVDMYEGGYFHTRGIYRSEATSCMNNNIPYYSAIQRQEMVERIMKYAGQTFSLDDFYAKDVRDASNNTITRSAKPSATEQASARKQWAPRIMGDKPKLN